MDKKSILGILLIFVILIGWQLLMKPSEEELQAAKQKRDSIALVEAERAAAAQLLANENKSDDASVGISDTVSANELVSQKRDEFGVFGANAIGEETFYTLENNLMKITFSNKGGRVYSVELKGYTTHNGQPLVLFDGPETLFGLNFFAQNRSIQTDQFYFKSSKQNKNITVTGPDVKKGDEGKQKFNTENPGGQESISFKLEVAPGQYMEYVYTLKYNSYLVDFDLNMKGMNQYIASNQSYLNFSWSYDVPRQERISSFGEDRYTNITYKYFEDEVGNLSQNKSDEENLITRVKWVGFKQLFFSSTLIANESFANAVIRQNKMEDNQEYLSNFYADFSLPYQGSADEKVGMQFFFGPNHYQTLKQYDIDLERQVYLGYAIVRPVNRYLIIPVFNFLRQYINNFGIIILLLTVFIKTILFPFTYKSYMSQAKMRALKPEVDEINKKYGSDKAMEKQQATMALYKKAGVNPMGGCLPMVLQMPILFAMFFFFPTSIELRQEGFLWATDLSTYDTIFNLPFTIPIYGDHVSLFCLLMTVTTIISTRLSQQNASTQTMPGMKSMMYMMPIMFLFILNRYPSGLSFYYLLANLFTIGQTYLIRSFVDDEKIRAQLQVNKKKPVKKSNFQKRLEDMAKQRGMNMPKK